MNGGRIDIGAVELKFMLGDINRDGAVNLLDVDPFIELISMAMFQRGEKGVRIEWHCRVGQGSSSRIGSIDTRESF